MSKENSELLQTALSNTNAAAALLQRLKGHGMDKHTAIITLQYLRIAVAAAQDLEGIALGKERPKVGL